MSYARLSQHFRDTGNVWQTATEVASALDMKPGTVASVLTVMSKPGCKRVQKERRRDAIVYRIRPARLHDAPPRTGEKAGARLERLAADFCAKWDVSVPSQATMKSEEAMLEWSRVTG